MLFTPQERSLTVLQFFRKAGVRDEKGSPCLLSPQEPHRCVTVSSLPVPLACLPKMALQMSMFWSAFSLLDTDFLRWTRVKIPCIVSQ